MNVWLDWQWGTMIKNKYLTGLTMGSNDKKTGSPTGSAMGDNDKK